MRHGPVRSTAVGRYWGLSNPFCCVHRSRDFQSFSIRRKTPKLLFPVEDLDLHLYMVLGPRWVRLQTVSRWFSRFCIAHPYGHHTHTHTHTHTDHATCDICRNRPHAMRPNKKENEIEEWSGIHTGFGTVRGRTASDPEINRFTSRFLSQVASFFLQYAASRRMGLQHRITTLVDLRQCMAPHRRR